MRFHALLGSFFVAALAVACGEAAAHDDACGEVAPANPAGCPAELPAPYSACSPDDAVGTCRYPGKGAEGEDGCPKSAAVSCIVEGPDSGQRGSPVWWPQP